MNKASTIYAVCCCGHFEFDALSKLLRETAKISIFKNVIQMQSDDGIIYIFDYGVIVMWNITEEQSVQIFTQLQGFMHDKLKDKLDDQFTFEINAEKTSIRDDHLQLNNDNEMTRLAVSHAIAQSTKIIQYESRVQNTINTTAHIPVNIAETGKSGLNRKELARMRGFLYLTKSDVMLHYDLLDTPEFFWENPDLQHYYNLLADYLEIKPRIEVLNKKLETIQSLLQMIADELQHAHSSLLEWIIIWLIALDIAIMLFQELTHTT